MGDEDDWFWGNRRGGGGAPVRDSHGNAVPNIKVALRGGNPNQQMTPTAHSGRMDSGHGPYHSPSRQQYNGPPGGQRHNNSPGRQRYNDPRYESPPPNMRRASLALMHGADVQERHEKYLQQKNYQQYLLEQIEEKNRRKAQEKAERERLDYEDQRKFEEEVARERMKESLSRTDTFALSSNRPANSPPRNVQMQSTRSLVRASSESNIAVRRHDPETSLRVREYEASDPPRQQNYPERESGLLTTEALDFLRSAAMRTPEGMVMVSDSLFERVIQLCENLVASHAQLERQVQQQHSHHHQPNLRMNGEYSVEGRAGYNSAHDHDDEHSIVNSVTEERERMGRQKVVAKTREMQETRPTRSQSQHATRSKPDKPGLNGNGNPAGAARRGSSQPPANRKSGAAAGPANSRTGIAAGTKRPQRSSSVAPASGVNSKKQANARGVTRTDTSNKQVMGVTKSQAGPRNPVAAERGRKPTQQPTPASPRRRNDKLPNLKIPAREDGEAPYPPAHHVKPPRSRVGTPGTELQTESNLLYLPPDKDAEYIGEDQLDMLLQNARATRNADAQFDRDYRGMS